MRVIERAVGEGVSEDMLQEAKNLRLLATLIEGGTCVGVAFAWVQTKEGDNDLHAFSNFCGDKGCYTILGAVSVLQHKLARAVHKLERSD